MALGGHHDEQLQLRRMVLGHHDEQFQLRRMALGGHHDEQLADRNAQECLQIDVGRTSVTDTIEHEQSNLEDDLLLDWQPTSF